jgi:hypothetical protein
LRAAAINANVERKYAFWYDPPFALAALAALASPATTPTSPGACHMLDANALGLAGMGGSQGGKNMVPLVVASLGAGCTP